MDRIAITDIPTRETTLPHVIKELQSRGLSKGYIDCKLIDMHNQGQIMLRSRKISGRSLADMSSIAIITGNRIFTTVERIA